MMTFATLATLKGLVRYSVNPSARPSATLSAMAAAVMAITGMFRVES